MSFSRVIVKLKGQAQYWGDIRFCVKNTFLVLFGMTFCVAVYFQDSLLPHVEDGTLTLIGATTENPSFQVNNALLSRCRVIVLEKLDNEAIYKILMNAIDQLGIQVFDLENDIHHGNKDEGQDSKTIWIENLALEILSKLCDGDARIALNGLQMTIQSQVAKSSQSQSGLQNKAIHGDKDKADVIIRSENVKQALQKSHIAYDKTGER